MLNGYRCAVKKVLLAIRLRFFGIGLGLLPDDADTWSRCGVHRNDVASITKEGCILHWPTGELPWFTQVAVRGWVVMFRLSAAGLYALRFCVSKPYPALIWRGTE